MILARQFLRRSKGTAEDVGEYLAANLIPSTYMVRVVVAGFRTVKRQNILGLH